MNRSFTVILLLVLTIAPGSQGAENFAAQDTLQVQVAETADARDMLRNLVWTPQPFAVTRTAGEQGCDWLVSFPSPRPQGDQINDRVVMEWYAAMDEKGKPIKAPAMVIVHILDGRMLVARTIARTFAFNGIHSFVIHLPYYGRRRPPGHADDFAAMPARWKQGIADVRRGKDAVAALPHVNKQRIGLQSTSLGGFVATVAGSVDNAFDPVFLVLAGADLHGMFLNGERDTAKIRAQLAHAGFTPDNLRQFVWQVEPSRVANRLDPRRTWLFSAIDDTVVPAANARVLAETARLDEQHHIWLTGDHYTCAMHLPRITMDMINTIQQSPREQ